MKKRMLATILALCMVLPMGIAAFAEGDELEEPEGLPDGMWDKMTDEQRAKYEEYLEFKEAKDGQSGEAEEAETAEVNEYGLTDAATQALAGKIRAHLREDYLNVYGIAAADFSWSEVSADVWNAVGAVPSVAYMAGQSLTDSPEELGCTFEDESLNALAGAVAAALREWVIAEGDDSFEALWGSLTDGRTFSQFVTEYAVFRPGKTAEDSHPISDEDMQELMSYVGKSFSEEYFVPNEISAEDFAWPDDDAAWLYYNTLLTQVYFKATLGVDRDELITEDIIPASPDKEIMDAVAHGILNWLYQFESVESVYLDDLFVTLRDYQYIKDNVTF